MDIFSYDFMIKAFLVAIMISLIAPCIGMVIVLKRMSVLGETLSHNALAGIALGLVMGINPVLGAVVFALLAVFSIEFVRKAMPRYSDLATTIVLSAGIGLAAIFSGFIKNGASLNSFLFGSIVAISDFELFLTLGLGIAVLLISFLFYKELFYVTFDEEAAKLAGVPVKTVNFIFMLMTAVTIAVASRTVGALIISSLTVVPVASAMMLGKSYQKTLLASIGFALGFTIVGLFIAYYADLKPGGTIVLTGVGVLISMVAFKNLFRKA